MSRVEQINQELQALSDAYAASSLGQVEFRRRRRELICAWTGEPLPANDELVEDVTEPGLRPVTDADLAQATPPVAPQAGKASKQRWLTVGLLVLAAAGAALVVWFVLRR